MEEVVAVINVSLLLRRQILAVVGTVECFKLMERMKLAVYLIFSNVFVLLLEHVHVKLGGPL